jgi:Transposase DDE domain group 1
VFADLIDGPLAHIPSGRFGANSAWVLCAAIAHNLLRAAATLAGTANAAARGATLRRKIVNIPARLARPQRQPVLHLPSHWPWTHAWLTLWRNTIGHQSTA